mmetsp:Transcript_39118/g.43796  ORF Transcript_39118/g.43796 Transcript_39118/m.43796 type:complete len:100 (-) Transcript_39118:324-623(-)
MHDSKTTYDEKQKYQITSVTSQSQSQSHINRQQTNKPPMNQSNDNNNNNDNDELKKYRNRIKSIRKETKYSRITPKNKTPDLIKSGRQEECSSSKSPKD